MRLLSCFVLIAALSVSGCGSDDDGGGIPTAPSANVSYSATDLRVGSGAEPTNGRTATINYTGWVYSTTAADNKGAKFDSTLDPGRAPYGFVYPGNFIQGFTMGLNGMRVGGLRRVVIPPSLGYGNSPPANSGIRANETLLFEIELLAVQ
jgi:FKBP-type peptidyl-prolyl cis-trans isomerase